MRGFTAFSEETEPTRLFALVSALLADQVHIIHEFGGYVDKFGGDGVMATQLVCATMGLAGGLLWLHRPQVSHGR